MNPKIHDTVSYVVVCINSGNDALLLSYKELRSPYHSGDIPALEKRVLIVNIVPMKNKPYEWDTQALTNFYKYRFYSNGRDIRIKFQEHPVKDLHVKATLIQK